MFNEPYNYSFIFAIFFAAASMPIKESILYPTLVLFSRLVPKIIHFSKDQFPQCRRTLNIVYSRLFLELQLARYEERMKTALMLKQHYHRPFAVLIIIESRSSAVQSRWFLFRADRHNFGTLAAASQRGVMFYPSLSAVAAAAAVSTTIIVA